MTFSIVVTNEISEDGEPVACIQLDEHVEHFPLDLSYWNAEAYVKQWRDSLKALVTENHSVALLITSVEPPAEAGRCTAFVLYKEGDSVFVQQHLLAYRDSRSSINWRRLLASVGRRETIDEDGNRISEWNTEMEDIRAFLAASDVLEFSRFS